MHPTSSFDYEEVSDDNSQHRLKSSDSFWVQRASHGWSFEILCMTTSFLCTGAICIILIQMNGKAAQRWSFHFTINSVVASLSTLLKITVSAVLASCLSQMKWLHFKASARQLHDLDIFDAASRGSIWGAGVVLWCSARRWSSFAAAVAAFTTLLVLPTSIAVQQLIGSKLYAIEVEGENVTFPLCKDYDGGTQSDAGHGMLYYPQASTADVKMQGAIYNGIFNMSIASAISCPSICIWFEGNYSTLAFDTNCTNVTSTMVVTHSDTDWPHSYSVMTPNNISMSANYSETDYQAVVVVKAIDLTGYGASTMPAEFIRIGILKSPVADVDTYIIDPDLLEGYECTVAFSGYSFDIASSNGTSFAVNKAKTTQLGEGFVMSGLAAGQDSSDLDINTYYVQFNQTDLPTMTARVPDIGGIVQFFTSDRFSGTVYNGESIPNDPQGVGVALLNADIDTAFRAMADSMALQLRQGKNCTPAYGKILNEVPFVRVNWYYLILPLAVQFLSLGLLIQTWLYNKRSQVTLWKDSTVAVLYHAVVSSNGSSDIIRTGIDSAEELNTLAKQSKARLD